MAEICPPRIRPDSEWDPPNNDNYRNYGNYSNTVTMVTMCFQWILGGEPHDETALRKDEIFFYTSHTLSHFVNSALNPIILIALVFKLAFLFVNLKLKRLKKLGARLKTVSES